MYTVPFQIKIKIKCTQCAACCSISGTPGGAQTQHSVKKQEVNECDQKNVTKLPVGYATRQWGRTVIQCEHGQTLSRSFIITQSPLREKSRTFELFHLEVKKLSVSRGCPVSETGKYTITRRHDLRSRRARHKHPGNATSSVSEALQRGREHTDQTPFSHTPVSAWLCQQAEYHTNNSVTVTDLDHSDTAGSLQTTWNWNETATTDSTKTSILD